MKQKLLKMIQVTVLFFFIKSKKWSSYDPKTAENRDFDHFFKYCQIHACMPACLLFSGPTARSFIFQIS